MDDQVLRLRGVIESQVLARSEGFEMGVFPFSVLLCFLNADSGRAFFF